MVGERDFAMASLYGLLWYLGELDGYQRSHVGNFRSHVKTSKTANMTSDQSFVA